MARLEFWFEFASTYSYLSASRISALAGDVDIVWRPFLLGPIFAAQGWNTSPFTLFAAKGANMWRDMERQAKIMGLPPVVRPDPFPQNSLLAARMAVLGTGQPWLPAFVRAVYHAQFAEGAQIDDPAVLGALLTDLGCDGVALVERAGREPGIKADLRAATDEAQAKGLYGAPSFVARDGELFWGNDRLEAALDWARGLGV